jgi:hypothetical protein
MEEQHDDHGARAVGVQAAQKRTGRDGFRDVRDGGVRVVSGGNIKTPVITCEIKINNKPEPNT